MKKINGKRERIYKKYGYKCFYCRVDMTDNTCRPLDHLIPSSRGGDSTEDNLVPCCNSCNSFKGVRTPEEWQEKIQTIIENMTYDLGRWKRIWFSIEELREGVYEN